MKRLILLFAALFCSAFAHATACPTGYGSTYKIPIPPVTSLSGGLSNWPMYWAGDSHVATVANSGLSQSTGLDVVFCDAATGGNLLPYELVASTYTASSGAGEWWIKVPTIFNATTTEYVYVQIGKASASDQSCGLSGYNNCGTSLWSAFLSVYHFGIFSNGNPPTLTDSTGNTSPTNSGTTSSSQAINGGAYSGAGTNYINTGSTQAASLYTIESWASPNGSNIEIVAGNSSSTASGVVFYTTGPGTPWGTTVQVSNGASISTYRSSTYPYLPGENHHIAGVYNGGNATLTSSYALYGDGASIAGSMTSTSVTSIGTISTNMYLLNYGSTGAGFGFSGDLDEIHICGCALSADWIKADYLNQSAPTSFYSTLTFVSTNTGTSSARHKIINN